VNTILAAILGCYFHQFGTIVYPGMGCVLCIVQAAYVSFVKLTFVFVSWFTEHSWTNS